ncbi:MAG: heparin lyase I family protein [Deltaproteobacteria bacterium]
MCTLTSSCTGRTLQIAQCINQAACGATAACASGNDDGGMVATDAADVLRPPIDASDVPMPPIDAFDAAMASDVTDVTRVEVDARDARPDVTSVSGLVTYDWDTASFPRTAWRDNATIPNTLGTPPNNGQPLGSAGWETAVEYTNSLNSISTAQERSPGRASVHLILNPYNPTVPGTEGPSNFRAEVFLTPFHYLIPVPSEQWISWSFYFPAQSSFFDASTNGEGAIHQLHASNHSPVVELWHHGGWGNYLIVTNRFGDGNNQMEVAFNTHYSIGAGHWVDFIEHVQWATDSTGLYELWIAENGVTTLVRTYSGPNTFSPAGDGNPPYGGTPKLGFYHYGWHGYGDATTNAAATANVNAYQATGGTQLEAYLGPVRIYNLPAGHFDRRGFDLVNPGSY